MALSNQLQVGIDLVPLADGGNDAQVNQLVAHLAQVVVAGIELLVLAGQTLRNLVAGTILVEGGVHCHHDVVVLVVANVGAHGEAELLAAHGCADHLYRQVSGALERAAATQLDDLGATLGDVNLHLLPLLSGELGGTDDVSQLAASNLNMAAEHCHLLTVATIGSATGDLALHHVELLGQRALQTGGV